MQERFDQYKSAQAREARLANATARRLVREFGDPNTGDYRDPFMELPTRQTVFSAVGNSSIEVGVGK